MPKVGIITQARMTSTRLPGKVLLKASGKTIFEHHANRLSWSGIPIHIATTVNETDQPIVDLADSMDLPCFRGDEHNVLQRFYQCAKEFDLDVVVRVTSDCPLIDGFIIGNALSEFLSIYNDNLYYSNCLTRTFPRGLDFEIFSFNLLEDAFINATLPGDKEHVTPYIHQNRSQRTTIGHYIDQRDCSDLRWTLDTEGDWKLIKELIETYKAASLRYSEILSIVDLHPELATLNAHIKQKEI